MIDRPARPGGHPGIAGQSSLIFESAPEEVMVLKGMDIWGAVNVIMLGDERIANRQGCTRIAFVDRRSFIDALAAYHERRHPAPKEALTTKPWEHKEVSMPDDASVEYTLNEFGDQGWELCWLDLNHRLAYFKRPKAEQ